MGGPYAEGIRGTGGGSEPDSEETAEKEEAVGTEDIDAGGK